MSELADDCSMIQKIEGLGKDDQVRPGDQADVRRFLKARLSREEVGVLWFDVLGCPMDDHMFGRSIDDCIIAFLAEVLRKRLWRELARELVTNHPDLCKSMTQERQKSPVAAKAILVLDGDLTDLDTKAFQEILVLLRRITRDTTLMIHSVSEGSIRLEIVSSREAILRLKSLIESKSLRSVHEYAILGFVPFSESPEGRIVTPLQVALLSRFTATTEAVVSMAENVVQRIIDELSSESDRIPLSSDGRLDFPERMIAEKFDVPVSTEQIRRWILDGSAEIAVPKDLVAVLNVAFVGHSLSQRTRRMMREHAQWFLCQLSAYNYIAMSSLNTTEKNRFQTVPPPHDLRFGDFYLSPEAIDELLSPSP